MLLNQEQIDRFYVQGFVKADRLLDDAAVDQLREELQAVLNGRSRQGPELNRNLLEATDYGKTGTHKNLEVRQVVNIWEASKTFFEVARMPELTATVVRLCNNPDTLRIWHDQIQYKPPLKGGPTNWHQDHPAWSIIVPADLVSAWIALDDAEVDNGCMWMVPGSHRWGRIPLSSSENFEPLFEESLLPQGVTKEAVNPQPLIVRKGEVAFHHCMTWHGSPHNRSQRPRRAYAIHYMPGYTLYYPNGKHVMEKHVSVKAGEVLQGEGFPVVHQRS